MDPQLNNGMCRCCASEGTFKDVKTTYHWMGDEEVYAEMLRECFDIALSVNEGDDGGICEVCITQLRNASNFKKQVQHTEEQFKKRLQDELFKTDIVKIEVGRDDDNDSDIDNNASDDFSGPEYEIPIKKEEDVEFKPTKKRAAAKATTSRAKKTKTEDGETSTKRVKRRVNYNSECETGMTSESDLDYDEKSVPEYSKASKIVKAKLDVDKHCTNLREILLCSNATPIKTPHNMYGCSFCKEFFIKPADLKRHIMDHDDHDKEKLANKKDSYAICVSLDVTGLLCKICHCNIDSLEELIHHLKYVHGKKMSPDSMTHILPFKFDTKEFRCVICDREFYSHQKLRSHMTEHYKNYTCKQCNVIYADPGSFLSHMLKHRSGYYKCNECPAVFLNRIGFTGHVKSHKKITTKNAKCDKLPTPKPTFKCNLCSEVFSIWYRRKKHLKEVHGIVPNPVKCMVCEKTFNNANALTVHTRGVHLMERPFKCELCDKVFYKSDGLKKHMISHTKERRFRCDICSKFFTTKYALEVHIRIHLNDRRFKCELCDQAFIQKAGWKSHMWTKHSQRP